MPFPHLDRTLTDGVLTLRPHRSDDAEALTEQSRDEQSQRWTTVPRGYTPEDAEKFLASIEEGWAAADGNRYWALEADGLPYAGTIDLRPVDPHGVSSTGYGLHPAARGRGLMARALRLACGHWFERGGRRVLWKAGRGNFPSWRVAHAAGFAMHATVPDDAGLPDGPADSWLGSVAAGEPLEPRTPWYAAVPLDDPRVRLRAWRDEDGATVEVPDHPGHHMPEGAAPTADTFAGWLLRRREHMSRGDSVCWCVADPGSDRALGEIGVLGIDRDGGVGELGYQLWPSARGQGLASRAARLATAYALSPVADGGLGLRRLVAQSAADNEPSNAVLRAAGFEVWGREAAVDLLPDGTLGDLLHWQWTGPPARSHP